jgi:Zn-dependent protease with chaperone function
VGQQAKGLAWLLAAAAVAVLFAVGLPELAAKLPWPVEKKLGAALGTPRACEPRPGAGPLLDRVVARLYPILPEDQSFPVEISVAPGPTVNAFATLGGRIYVYEGLLKEAESPEELAGVLAHEIEHVRRRHIIEGAVAKIFTSAGLRYLFGDKGGLGSSLLNLSFSRSQEREADEGGLARLKAAHVDVSGYEDFFARADKRASFPALLSDHPSNSGRAELARSFRGGPVEPVLAPEEWRTLQKYCR